MAISIKHISRKKISLFQQLILSWFNIYGRHYFPWRKESLTSYEIVISEILLQRTKAETVEKFYPVFLASYSSWRTIANEEVTILEESLKPIGLYRQRAKRLKDLAQEMAKLNGQFPESRQELESIPFLGQYIANAIELQLFNKARPLLDVNMARVLERFFGERTLADIRYDPYLQTLAITIVNHPAPKEINWAILDFAALVCKARKPLCEKCLLSNTCTFYKKSYLK